jgi:predicted DNA-binding transcriptional regulator AlpA
MKSDEPIRLLGWDDLKVKGITASKPSIYRWVKAGKFPRPIYAGKSPTWPEQEIDNYIRNLIAKRDASSLEVA